MDDGNKVNRPKDDQDRRNKSKGRCGTYKWANWRNELRWLGHVQREGQENVVTFGNMEEGSEWTPKDKTTKTDQGEVIQI